MAWTAPMTAIAGSVFTAAQFNTFVRDNLAETAPAKATTPGSHFAVTGTGSIAERTPTTALISGTDSTSSSTYGDLDTSAGPSVTLTTGQYALYVVHASCSLSANSAVGRAAVDISGASSIAPVDNRGVGMGGVLGATPLASSVVWESNLTPGSNTFKILYRVTLGTANFASRRIIVIPF